MRHDERALAAGGEAARVQRFFGRALKAYLMVVIVTETALSIATPFVVSRFEDSIRGGMYDADQIHPFVATAFDQHWWTLALAAAAFVSVVLAWTRPRFAWIGATSATLFLLGHFGVLLAFFILALKPAYTYQPLA